MNREDFTEGSVEQIIFDFWNGEGGAKQYERFEERLQAKDSEELIEFIITAQSKGCFGQGFIHE